MVNYNLFLYYTTQQAKKKLKFTALFAIASWTGLKLSLIQYQQKKNKRYVKKNKI